MRCTICGGNYRQYVACIPRDPLGDILCTGCDIWASFAYAMERNRVNGLPNVKLLRETSKAPGDREKPARRT